MNRRQFIRGVGSFAILAGAGRPWSVAAGPPQLAAYWTQTRRSTAIMGQLYRDALSRIRLDACEPLGGEHVVHVVRGSDELVWRPCNDGILAALKRSFPE